MKKLISAKMAGNILLVCLGLLSIFHILVLLRVIPSDIVWGGQIGGSSSNLYMLELISLIVTFVFMAVIVMKVDNIKTGKPKKVISVAVWVIFAYMLLNTIGNLASGVSFENMIFAPISLVLAFFALRLAIEN